MFATRMYTSYVIDVVATPLLQEMNVSNENKYSAVELRLTEISYGISFVMH